MGSQPAMTPEERQEIRERHLFIDDTAGDYCDEDQQDWPCDTARLLADYDHLVEVARAYVVWVGFVPEGGQFDALRALIDPATRRTDEAVWAAALADPAFVAALEEGKADLAAGRRVEFDPATPEPVEGEPNA